MATIERLQTLYKTRTPSEGPKPEYYELVVESKDVKGKTAFFVTEKFGIWDNENKRVEKNVTMFAPADGYASLKKAIVRLEEQLKVRVNDGFEHSFSPDYTEDAPGFTHTNLRTGPILKFMFDPVLNELIGNLGENYSIEHFRFAINEVRKVVSQLVAEDLSSDQQKARYRILRYLDLHLVRANTWADGEADLMAFVMRGLIELRGLATFVSKSEENATRFLNEAMIDEQDLYDRIVKLRPKEWGPLPEGPNATGERVRIKPDDGQEELMWKMSSKLIHPSSWGINHFNETVVNPDLRTSFAVHVAMYAWEIVILFHNLEWVE